MAQKSGYSGLQIGLHWLIAILFAVNYFTGEWMVEAFDAVVEGEGVAGGSLPASLHQYFGLAILGLAVLRLVVRLTQGVPDTPHDGPAILNTLAGLVHWVLYALLLVVPVLGALAWYQGLEDVGDLHVLVMNAMLVMIGLHTLAALFHQYYLRDGLLLRMMRPR